MNLEKKMSKIGANVRQTKEYAEQIGEYVQRGDDKLDNIIAMLNTIIEEGGINGRALVVDSMETVTSMATASPELKKQLSRVDVDQRLLAKKKADIISRAIQDVDRLLGQNQLPYEIYGTPFFLYDVQASNARVKFEYKTNRYVTAVLEVEQHGVWRKWKSARAICRKDMEYIPVIGKVIALYRLFDMGDAIPEYYLDFPQVGEVELDPYHEVGDVSPETTVQLTIKECIAIRNAINVTLNQWMVTDDEEEDALKSVRNKVRKEILKHGLQ